jgi:hypothetical protein
MLCVRLRLSYEAQGLFFWVHLSVFFSLSLFCVKVISEVIIGLRVVFAECRRNKKDEKKDPSENEHQIF